MLIIYIVLIIYFNFLFPGDGYIYIYIEFDVLQNYEYIIIRVLFLVQILR